MKGIVNIFVSAVLAGCVKIGYNEPISGPLAQINVSINESDFQYSHNVPVYRHTDNCDTPVNSLIGLINSMTVGIPEVDTVSFNVQASKKFSFSVQGLVRQAPGFGPNPISYKTLYCRNIIDIEPLEGRTYSIELSHKGGNCDVRVMRDSSPVPLSGSEVSIRQGCELPFLTMVVP
ncbi:hypothetical protein ACG1BZ_09335 [Microbulbifer sp. CNSA002]|uniref:hypothetical protein n=1 Tax=Microbulbifer sp. CNSA002 TaxID=3373604 RepID=UPI0039B6364B